MLKETLPETADTPTTSNVTVRLLGVKMTLNRLAVKLEFAWQGLSDFDSINCRPPMFALTPESRERRDIKVTKGESIEDRMVGNYL